MKSDNDVMFYAIVLAIIATCMGAIFFVSCSRMPVTNPNTAPVAQPVTPSGLEGAKKAMLTPSYYWIAEEKPDAEKVVYLLDENEDEITKVSREFRSAIRMEGSGRLADGRVVTLWDDELFFVLPKSVTWGYGNKNNPITPFKSVAMDQSIYPFGTKIFIPKLVGVKLPDASTHDGYLRVDDVGSAIKGPTRVDLFCGNQAGRKIYEQAGIPDWSPVEAYIVK